MGTEKLKIEVQSEIGKLNAVLLHRPGAEVENMGISRDFCKRRLQKTRYGLF